MGEILTATPEPHDSWLVPLSEPRVDPPSVERSEPHLTPRAVRVQCTSRHTGNLHGGTGCFGQHGVEGGGESSWGPEVGARFLNGQRDWNRQQ